MVLACFKARATALFNALDIIVAATGLKLGKPYNLI